MSREVEYITDLATGKQVMASKCASCLKDVKTCGTLEHEYIREREYPIGDPLSYKIVWCRFHDRVDHV